ncbi:MAG: sulfite exporter TauE/SafE family protein [Calditrichaeota bacterium]|nr:MAG: sulfite exporter TauE/SafE family protein [Calditrichota bacterium]
MPIEFKLLLLTAVGFSAGFINIFAGGGSTLTLPALIFFGLDAATANGTNRIALLIQNIFATGGFHQKQVHGIKQALLFALFTLPGALAGAFFSVRIPDIWFQRILAAVMVAVIFTFFINPRYGQYTADEERAHPGPAYYVTLSLIGFYGGFIQVGVGFILMAALYNFLHTSLVRVNFYKIIIILFYTIPALAVFIWHDKVNWTAGFVLATGNALGGWVAARTHVKKGDTWVRYILALAILIMAVKLLWMS